MSDKATQLSDNADCEGKVFSRLLAGGEAVLFSEVAPGKESPNEDSVGVFPYGPAAAVLAVADGAGGMPAGQKASSTAVQQMFANMQASMEQTQLLRTAVLNGIEAANAAVLDLANGSATTLTVIAIEGSVARCYHVGDSPAWIIGQRGKLHFEAVAHSPVGLAVESGFLSEVDAMYHPDRNIVSNFLGTVDMRIEVSPEIRLAQYDTVVLASDGLNDNLFVSEVIEKVRCGPLAKGAENLVEATRRRMFGDQPLLPSKPDDLSLIAFRKRPKKRAPK